MTPSAVSGPGVRPPGHRTGITSSFRWASPEVHIPIPAPSSWTRMGVTVIGCRTLLAPRGALHGSPFHEHYPAHVRRSPTSRSNKRPAVHSATTYRRALPAAIDGASAAHG